MASKCDATTCCVLVPSRVMTWDEINFELISFKILELMRSSQLIFSPSFNCCRVIRFMSSEEMVFRVG